MHFRVERCYVLFVTYMAFVSIFQCSGLVVQEVADQRTMFTNFPGCMMFGQVRPQNSKIGEVEASSAAECYQQCLNRWQNSRYRGVFLELRQNDIKISPKQTEGYIGASILSGSYRSYGMSSYGTHQDQYDWVKASGTSWDDHFYHDAMESATIHPCYKFEAWTWGSASRADLIGAADFSDHVQEVSNLNPNGDETGADIADLWAAESPLMCSVIGLTDYKDTLEQEACLSWYWNTDKNSCKLYVDEIDPVNDNFATNFKDGTKVSGNLYCENDFTLESIPVHYAEMLERPGCIFEDYTSPHFTLESTNVDNFHDCRRTCQTHVSCATFEFRASVETGEYNCLLKEAGSWQNLGERLEASLGARDCPTCLPGYYIKDTTSTIDSCQICPRGSFCSDGERTTCAAGSFCGNLGQSTPLVYNTTNHCSNNYSGLACQHPVCENSGLGKTLRTIPYQEPYDFDFANYEPESLNVEQTLLASKLAFQMKVTTSILPVIAQSYTLRVKTSSGSLVGETTIIATSFDCVNNSTTLAATIQDSANKLSVGASYYACVEISWKNPFKPLQWDELDNLSTIAMSSEEHCISGIVSFVAGTLITTNNIDGDAPSGNVNIQILIGSGSIAQTLVTSSTNGTLKANIFDSSSTSTSSSIIISSASVSDKSTKFKLCPPDLETSACTKKNALNLPQMISLTNLLTSQIRLVDLYSREIRGSVAFLVGEDECGIQDVQVQALNAGNNDAEISSVVTDANGGFVLGVPQDSVVKLKLSYHDHTFVLVSDSVDSQKKQSLVSEGLRVSSDLSNVNFKDTKLRTLNLHTSATLCDFNVGSVTTQLRLTACPSIKLEKTFEDQTVSWRSLPATNFMFDLIFEDDEDIQASYAARFPSSVRRIDLTEATDTIEVVYHPVPSLDISVVQGGISFDTCETQSLPFEYLVEGGQTITIKVETLQSYRDHTSNSVRYCREIPGETFVEVSSNLAPETDTKCDGQQPCTISFKGFDDNIIVETSSNLATAAYVRLVVGEPELPDSNASVIKNLPDFVRTVNFRLINDVQWPASLALDGLDTEMRTLVMGTRTTSESAILTSPDAVPLFYLYAPPITATEKPSYARAKFSSAISTNTNVHALIEADGGIVWNTQAKTGIRSVLGRVSFDNGTFEINTTATSLNDRVQTVMSSRSFELQTTPETGDMALFLESSTKFTEAVHLEYDDSTCAVLVHPSVTWGQTSSNLVFASRASCEASLDESKETLVLYAGNSQAQQLLRHAFKSKERWQNLLAHWDKDYQGARNFPIDLRGQVTGDYVYGENRLQMGVGKVSFEESSVPRGNQLLDYLSASSSQGYGHTYDFAVAEDGLGRSILSLQADSNSGLGASWSVVREAIHEFMSDDSEPAMIDVASHIVLEEDRGEICIDFFRSPHSGSHVYYICGGLTRCPFVPGTTQREVFSLLYSNETNGTLSSLTESTGSFSFYIDTSLLPISDDTLDLIITPNTDASEESSVLLSIDKTPIEEGVSVVMQGLNKRLIHVDYERVDTEVRSATVSIRVSSACDPSVTEVISFSLHWTSTCPFIEWDGNLLDTTSTWLLSSNSPQFPLHYRRGPAILEGVESEISLWALRYENGLSYGDWIELVSFQSNATSLVSYLDIIEVDLVNGGRYIFELRVSCTKNNQTAGSERSGRRLGMYDTHGPELVTWTPINTIRSNTDVLPVALFSFDEPIDCSAPSLRATVTQTETLEEVEGVISCTSNLNELTVSIIIEEGKTALWNQTEVSLSLTGVQDIFGNLAFEVSVSERHLGATEEAGLGVYLSTPSLQARAGEANRTFWDMPNAEEYVAMVDAMYAWFLPRDQILTSTYRAVDRDFADEGGSNNSTNGNLTNPGDDADNNTEEGAVAPDDEISSLLTNYAVPGIAIFLGCLVVLFIGVRVYRRKRVRPQSTSFHLAPKRERPISYVAERDDDQILPKAITVV